MVVSPASAFSSSAPARTAGGRASPRASKQKAVRVPFVDVGAIVSQVMHDSFMCREVRDSNRRRARSLMVTTNLGNRKSTHSTYATDVFHENDEGRRSRCVFESSSEVIKLVVLHLRLLVRPQSPTGASARRCHRSR